MCPQCGRKYPNDAVFMYFNKLKGHGYVLRHNRDGKMWCGLAGFQREGDKFIRRSNRTCIVDVAELDYIVET